jgi:hypothetical protein
LGDTARELVDAISTSKSKVLVHPKIQLKSHFDEEIAIFKLLDRTIYLPYNTGVTLGGFQ